MKQRPSKQCEDCFSWHEASFLYLSCLNSSKVGGGQDGSRKQERAAARGSHEYSPMADRSDRMDDGAQNLHAGWAGFPYVRTGREVNGTKNESTYGC